MSKEKRSLPAKKADSNYNLTDDEFGNELQIPKPIKDAMDKEGMVPRFVSAKRLSDSGGYHHRGWQVVNLEKLNCAYTNPFNGNIEKMLRRGDSVLAFKPKAAHEKHKEILSKRANAASASVDEYDKKAAKDANKKLKDKSQGNEYVKMTSGYEN